MRHLPTAALHPLAAWFNRLPSCGLPHSWLTSSITPLWKGRGSPTDPNTYRSLFVMHPVAKLFALTLLGRLDTAAEANTWRAREQAGFRRGHRIEDHQLLMTYILQCAAAGRGPVALGFIDLTKAYDSVPRARLWSVLADELGVAADLQDGILSLYRDSVAVVRVGSSHSAPFPVTQGVKQGCPMSPCLFSLFFDRVSAYLLEHAPGRTRLHCPYLTALTLCILLYADDVVLLATSAVQLQVLLHFFGTFCTQEGLTVSEDKSQVLLHGCSPLPLPFTCQGKTLQLVPGYKYLGQRVTVRPSLLFDLASH